MTVALIVDNPFRDLPGLVLVAWRLAQSGVTTFLVPMNVAGPEIWSLAPDFVLLNYLRANNEGLARHMMDAGIRVGVLDTEGSLLCPLPDKAKTSLPRSRVDDSKAAPALEWYSLTMARDATVRHRVACYCAWTPSFAEYASNATWYQPAQIVVTGTPRVDYCAPSWREAAKQMSRYADEYRAPLILINGSFPLANPGFQTPAQEVEMMVGRFSYDRDFVVKWQQTQNEGMRGLAALTNQLANAFPTATFLYRPHPFEDSKTYEALLKKLPNLRLVKRGTLEGWLLRASAVVHLCSSTAVDASLLGLPVFAPGWLPSHLPAPAVDDVSISCTNAEQLTRHINDVLEGRYSTPSKVRDNIQRVVENTYYKVDGRANQRVAEAVLKRLPAKRSPALLRNCRQLAYGAGRKSWVWKTRTAVAPALGLSVHWSFRRGRKTIPDTGWEKTEKRFGVETVSDILDAIQRDRQDCVAQRWSDYHFGYERGKSVAILPHR